MNDMKMPETGLPIHLRRCQFFRVLLSGCTDGGITSAKCTLSAVEGATCDADGPKPNGEKGGPEPGTHEQQRERIISAYKAASVDAQKSFRQWLEGEDQNVVEPHQGSVPTADPGLREAASAH